MLEPKVIENDRTIASVNAIQERLYAKEFFWTLEFVPSHDKALQDELDKLTPVFGLLEQSSIIAGFAVADRVVSDKDPDPIEAALRILLRTHQQPIVHFSGKGREGIDLINAIERMAEAKLQNILILSGDKLKEPNLSVRDRYLESVPAVALAKKINPQLCIAVAFNPFKYREEESMAQYFKLEKKLGAGADYAITQIGFDHQKYEELASWKKANGISTPIVANLMMLRAKSARYMRKYQLAGITITESFLNLLEIEESLPDKGADKALNRLALQMLGLKYLGYAGIQLTGLHTGTSVSQLELKLAQLEVLYPNYLVWHTAWENCMKLPNGELIQVAPPLAWYQSDVALARASKQEQLKFTFMKVIHQIFFVKGPISKVLSYVSRFFQDRHSGIGMILEKFERLVKAPLVGCETCGNCRLEFTQYICPETCPKGLANGPCGGTANNVCEFGDRECIHSVKYRIAKNAHDLDSLRFNLIPEIPKAIRHTSSYPDYFLGKGIQIKVVEEKSVDGLKL
jgi:methylenetetrahydrofolate reductase (NADPH)